MAEEKRGQLALSAQGMGSLPMLRQLGLFVGLAASIAIGITAAFWARTPNFTALYTGLSEKDVMEVTDALQKSAIPFELSGTGAVMVPADKVHDARLKLASQGLPNSSANGFELLDKDTGFGTSQFMEKARFQRALEGELARTISSMKSVESARVHLAIPKQSVFVRNQKQPSASVFVNLFAGRNLDDGQVASITHLVASSVPNLETEHVAVIDQKGRLLSAPDRSAQMGMTTSQFNYRKQLEEYLTKRIVELISPIVGVGGVQAQVSTELDFTLTEQTQESFNPDLPAIRSEQSMEDTSSGAGAANGGVPGALSNQPPAGGTTGPEATAAGAGSPNTRSNKQVTRNYELDRTISHTKAPSGNMRRLSAAVVVDDRMTTSETGETTRTPLTEQDIERIATLVKEAIGFDARRGDSVTVINSSFNTPPPAEPLPEAPLLEQPWVWQAAKILGGVIAVVLIAFGVLKPIMRSLAEKGAALPPPSVELQSLTPEMLAMATAGQLPHLPAAQGSYDANLNAAKSMVQQDPKRVAKVVRQWVGEDG